METIKSINNYFIVMRFMYRCLQLTHNHRFITITMHVCQYIAFVSQIEIEIKP